MNKLWSSICDHAHHRPEAGAILSYKKGLQEALTWGQLHTQAEALAQRLIKDDIRTLALQAENCPAWIITDIACSLRGIVLLPLPSFFSEEQIKHVLTRLHVDALLSDQAQKLQQCTGTQFCAQGELLGLSYLLATGGADSQSLCNTVPPGTQKITFTSGSTGSPKGVCLSADHQQRVTNSLLDATQPCAIGRHLCVLPLATLLENIAGVHAPLRRGAQVIVADMQNLGFNGASGFSLHVFLDTLAQCRPNSMILIPELLEALVMSCEAGWQLPASLQFIAVGGAAISPTLLRRAWEHRLPVYEGYGLSECASVVTLNTPEARKSGTLGRALKHTQVQIEAGEIIVYGPGFLGYVGEPASWARDPDKVRIATGDLAYCDEQGFLHYQGRRKNLLVSSFGRNISPEWVEAELRAQPEIGQSVVFGDAQPYCVALIAPAASTVTNAMLDAALLRVNAKLPSYAQVLRWHKLHSPLPRGAGRESDLMTANGRPRRAQIEAYFKAEIERLYVANPTIDVL